MPVQLRHLRVDPTIKAVAPNISLGIELRDEW